MSFPYLVVLGVTLLSQGTAPADGIVRASGAPLTCHGQPYRAIGVNVPHLSQASMGTWHHWRSIYGSREAMRGAIEETVADAARHDVAFIRFYASPGYPKGTAELYDLNRESCWQQMDELFSLCRQHRLKLVPALGTLFKWNLDCGEPRSAVLDPSSRTHAATYGYVREFVTRYRDDPTVLMWELENEAFLAADVDQQDRPAPGRGIYPADGPASRATFTREDSLRFEMLVQHYRDVTSRIKKLDPQHYHNMPDGASHPQLLQRVAEFNRAHAQLGPPR